MRRNSLFLILLLSFLSCTERRPTSLRLISYLDDESMVKAKLRGISSAGEELLCMKDLFSVSKLSEEVLRLEAAYKEAPKVRGKWRHLDLAKLPVPQANFLKTYGDEIGNISDPDSIDYSSCRDLPCVFNKIYGQDEGEAGFVHYLWYLKFGHMLALDNHVPRQKGSSGHYAGEDVPFSDYLFSHKELYGFWRLTQMLDLSYVNIPNLRQIQRVPRGKRLEEDNDVGACGLAGASGYIKLSDPCLTIYKDVDQGHLYVSIIHEMAHHIDYEEGRRAKLSHGSHQKNYLSLAGLYAHEYYDERGIFRREWKKRWATYVTDYAKTSPPENFAEVMAYYRMDGDLARATTNSQQLEYISQTFYSGQNYEEKSLILNWAKKYGQKLNRSASIAFSDCDGEERCFEQRADELELELRSQVMRKDPQACQVFSKETSLREWKFEVKERLIKSLNAHRLMLKQDPHFLAWIQSGKMGQQLATQAYVSCFGETDEALCYKDEIEMQIGDGAFARAYLSSWPFDHVQVNTLKGARRMVSAHEDTLRERAKLLWRSCSQGPDDIEPPSGEIFLLGEGYLVSSIYNCLNVRLPATIRDAVRGMKVIHGKEELLLTAEVKTKMVRLLKDIFEEERKKEVAMWPESPLYHLKKELNP